MPAVNVNISRDVLLWAVKQTNEDNLSSKLKNNIERWLDGTKTPTFNQIEEFSKKSNIPLGYFFLQTPPAENLELLEFRTVNSVRLAEPSRNLIDTIREMENVQDWMTSYRKELGFDTLSVVGSLKHCTDAESVASKMREDLNLDKNWYENVPGVREAFNYVRKKLEENCVIVMMNGIVGNNTQRALDADEFRAFALVNEWAPLIFINASDSLNARLFSLLHEAAHIWLGVNDLYNDRYSSAEKVSSLEMICNAAAGELLVPTDDFLMQWNNLIETADVNEVISELYGKFNCYEIVIARKALDNHKIGRDLYNKISQGIIDYYRNSQEKRESAGGNYYHTMNSRLDSIFVKALCESIKMGRTSYTEAYRLTNTSRKTFPKVIQNLGGLE